jgi:hypothetical protein
MKNVFKVLGIVALAAAIVLSMAGCPVESGSGGSGGGSGGGGVGGNEGDFIDIPLEFKGRTSDNKEITINLTPDSSDSRVAVNTRNAISYIIKVANEIISSGKITFNDSVKNPSVSFTFTPTSGESFQGSFENYKENIVIESLPGGVKAILGSVSEGKTVTITDINSFLKPQDYIVDEAYIDRIGVWLFETMPEADRLPVNTAIQSMSYVTTIPPVFNLVVPRDNTWNGDPQTGKAQPRWTGTGSYYVLIAPIVYSTYVPDLAYWIYTNGTDSPVKVDFTSDDVTLSITKFKLTQTLVTKTQLNEKLNSAKTTDTPTELEGTYVNVFSIITAYAFKGNGFAEVGNGRIWNFGTFEVDTTAKTITFTPSSGSSVTSPWTQEYVLTSSGSKTQMEFPRVPNHNFGPFEKH